MACGGAFFAGQGASGFVPAVGARFEALADGFLDEGGLRGLEAAVAEVRLGGAAFAWIFARVTPIRRPIARIAGRTLGHTLILMQEQRRRLVQKPTRRALSLDDRTR